MRKYKNILVLFLLLAAALLVLLPFWGAPLFRSADPTAPVTDESLKMAADRQAAQSDPDD